jgi:hypothetical protein
LVARVGAPDAELADPGEPTDDAIVDDAGEAGDAEREAS